MTFDDIFASAESFCIKFCTFIGNLYPHMSTDFLLFTLTFNEMALILLRAPIIFTVFYSPCRVVLKTVKCSRNLALHYTGGFCRRPLHTHTCTVGPIHCDSWACPYFFHILEKNSFTRTSVNLLANLLSAVMPHEESPVLYFKIIIISQRGHGVCAERIRKFVPLRYAS